MNQRNRVPLIRSQQIRVFAHRAIVLFLSIVVLLGPSAGVAAREGNVVIAQDQSRRAAEQAIEEGRRLRAENTTDSLKGSIAKFERALSLLEGRSDHRAKADLLNSLGQICLGLGETRQALDYYNRALPLARAARDRQVESESLVGFGTVCRVFGESYKALDYYNQALALARAMNDHLREDRILSAMALVYYVLGEYQKSLDIYSQCLLLARARGHKGKEASMLAHMGSVYNMMGDKQKALDSLNQALQLLEVRGDLLEQASVLQSIGRVYHSIREYQKAIHYLNQSLPLLSGAPSPNYEARARCNLGRAYVEMGEHQQALDHLNKGLQIWRATGDKSNTAEATHWLARLERSRGNLSEALAQIDVALDIIEWMRTKAVTQELRSAFLGSVQTYYEFKIEVLTRLAKLDPSKNYTASAFQVSEMARARSLLDTLVEAGADIRQDVSPGLLERERGIQQQLSAKAAEQMRLLSGSEPSKDLAAVEKQIEELSARYQEVQAEIRTTSPRYAALTQPEPLSLASIQQQLLDSQTVLLEYFLGAELSYLWVVTPDSIKGYELPKREEIEKLASRVYELLTARNRRVRFETVDEKRARIENADSEYAEAAAALSQVVLGPVAQEIAGKRLLIVSDGALQYIPFAALPEPSAVVGDQSSDARTRTKNNGSRTAGYGQPLAILHEVVSLPSALTLSVLRREIAGRRPAPRTIAVLADPVFDKDDERVKAALSQQKTGRPGINIQARSDGATLRSDIERSARESGWGEGEPRIGRLPFTRKEAQVIADLVVPASGRQQALDFEASRAIACSAELSQYRVVHFATHGFLNSAHPELSGIVLSLVDEQGRDQNGFLRAHEIYNLKLPAELVVLSGCRTGLGKEIKGEGLVGLTRAFMYAGAARVLVSLWDINDKATAEFMTRFYRAMLGKEQMRPAKALRAAQVSMWKERQWPSPYYWAAFVLQGETN